MFELDPRLENDTFWLGDFTLCRLLLMNERSYPWFILVPRRPGVSELHHLTAADQQLLWSESAELSTWLEENFSYDKLNVAALGNVVRQLHVHHVARRVGDPTWPGPVWGARTPTAYPEEELTAIRQKVAKNSWRMASFAGAD